MINVYQDDFLTLRSHQEWAISVTAASVVAEEGYRKNSGFYRAWPTWETAVSTRIGPGLITQRRTLTIRGVPVTHGRYPHLPRACSH